LRVCVTVNGIGLKLRKRPQGNARQSNVMNMETCVACFYEAPDGLGRLVKLNVIGKND
jgi:hypothetical protein